MNPSLISQALDAVAQRLGLSADTRLFDLQGDGPVAQLLVESHALRERLNAPWLMQLSTLSADATLDTQALLGQRVCLLSKLADGRSQARRSGLVTAARFDGADGELARYVLTVEPWLALLGHSQHSALWQERTVRQVIDAVFTSHAQLAAWHWSPCAEAHLAGSHQGGLRSLVVQYRETDLAFVLRLLAHEGLVLRLEEHPEAPGGQRAVILADTPFSESCPLDATSAADGGIRFHRASSQERQDAIQALGALRSLPATVSAALVWDYKTKRAVAAEVPTAHPFGGPHAPRLAQLDTLAAYRFADEADAQRAMTLAQQALEARHKTWIGRSTVRTFAVGTAFDLRDSPLDALAALKAQASSAGASADPDDTRFLLTELVHAGLNNLPPDALPRLGSLGAAQSRDDLWPDWVEPALIAQARASGYANRFCAIRASVPWRAPLFDEAGTPLHPTPRPGSALTATVVGPEGQTRASGADEIHTDALGRVRIAFDFQRAGLAPHAETSAASTWVRVAQRLAGAGMGWQFIPRVGQEVLVDFVDGAIDRPLIVGALYNGQGEAGTPVTPGGANTRADTSALADSHDHRASAQGNRIASGHSPAWHGAAPGAASAGAHAQANPAALNGIKTRGFGSPGTDFNQLLFDDSNAQLRVQFMTTQHGSQLNLGHLIHPADNHRGSLRGAGFELRSDAYGVVRAASGLLLSTHDSPASADVRPREGLALPALDNAPGSAVAARFKTLAQQLGRASEQHHSGTLAASAGSSAPGASALAPAGCARPEASASAWHTALKGMVNAASFEAAQSDAAAKNNRADTDQLPSPSDATLALHARAGWAHVAGADVQLAAADNITLASGQHSHWASGGAYRLHSGQAIGILAGAVQPGSAAAGSGITAIAAQGPTEIQAQAGPLEIAAQQTLSIQSEQAPIDWAAAKKITLATAGGASVTIEGGNITFECPGTITVRAASKGFSGPARISPNTPEFPKASMVVPLKLTFTNAPMGLHSAWAGMPYRVYANGALINEGVLDEAGQIDLLHSPAIQSYRVELANGMKYDCPVVDAYRNSVEGPLANQGVFKGETSIDTTASRTAYADALNRVSRA